MATAMLQLNPNWGVPEPMCSILFLFFFFFFFFLFFFLSFFFFYFLREFESAYNHSPRPAPGLVTIVHPHPKALGHNRRQTRPILLYSPFGPVGCASSSQLVNRGRGPSDLQKNIIRQSPPPASAQANTLPSQKKKKKKKGPELKDPSKASIPPFSSLAGLLLSARAFTMVVSVSLANGDCWA